MRRAVALIDGEHYAPVVRDALSGLPYRVVAAVVVGGTEKLRGGDDYGVPLADDLDAALDEHAPDVVFDLSDEPVLGPRERFLVASRVLARGIPYEGADFRFDPPELRPFPLPSLGIVGTGKRIGKTAVGGYVARLLARDHDVVVVAMGRGGPAEPQVAEVSPTVEDLLELSRAGAHAASDYLEDAALAGVVTIGCRRCGGGLAGAPVVSNVAEGARLAAERRPDLVVFEGSGAALPPIATTRRVLVAGAHQAPELVTGYLNAYRVLVSDLVVLTMAEEGARHEEVRAAVQELKPGLPVVATRMRPRPVDDVRGRRVAFFSTAPEDVLPSLVEHLEGEHGAEVVRASSNLARRDDLRRDLDDLDAEVFLVEIKAAAIDVVAEAAAERGAEIVFCDNELLPLEGEPDLDAELLALAQAARREGVRR
ncbi:MAG TPA: 2,3-diphosphoglycerate synthetase [Gaiellaceae bacterium]|jgi:cyclic 2,3-diphosphoglycerate synthase|nr:2,3-diphosphoglycerate synthetase [Gaiellaceae bacterium]